MVKFLFFQQDSSVLKGQKLVAGGERLCAKPPGKGKDLWDPERVEQTWV